MNARFWIAVLTCCLLSTTSGCGSCRWRHGRHPSACVSPMCGDPCCVVCSPLPSLYDGMSRHRQARLGGWGMGCGCGTCGGEVISGDCGPCETSCGMPMDCGSMPGCGGEMMMDGGSCGLPGWSNGVVCPNCQHQVMPSNSGPTTYESYESAEPAPTPATPPVGSPEHNAQIFHQQAIPRELHGGMQPIPVPRSSTPAERPPAPPVASPTSGVRPSDYYAPNKPVTHLPAPAPVTGPVKLTSPPAQWETSLTIEPLHQAGGFRLPPLP